MAKFIAPLVIQDIFDLIPSELNAKNKRFILKSLNENAKYDRYRNSFLWLADAGVALPTYNVEEPRMPLRLNELRNLFKLFLNDVGLLSSYYPFELSLKIIMGEANINYGAIYENLAAQELAAHGYSLYYFNNKRQGEIDFVVEHNGEVVPIEIKSGKDFKRHNALSNIMATPDYDIKSAMVISNANVSTSGRITYLPVYMLMFFCPTVSVSTMTYCIYQKNRKEASLAVFFPFIRQKHPVFLQRCIRRQCCRFVNHVGYVFEEVHAVESA